MKQAGYTVTDKLTSVVESNVKPDNDFRTIMVSEHDSKTDEVITKLTKISMITGLNNAAYSKSYTYGDSAYEITSEYEIPNHENETITVSGLPDGLTPTVKHERLANGSYKINMRDLMREPNGTTTLDLNVSDEFSNQLITGGIIVKPEYKLERLNDNGTQFIQIVKDPYGFNLYSKDISVGTEFAHSTVIPKNQFLSIDNKNKYGEYVSVADDKHSHIPLVAEYSYKGDGVGRATVVYDLTGIDSHFNKVLNTDATVYAYVNNTWVEVSKGDGNRDVELPSNTKKVALSHDNLVKDEAKSPKFDVSLDDVATFKSENKNTRKILDMHARIFNIPDAVTFMDEETINNTSTVLAERVLMLPEENWSYIVSIIKDRYDLPFETGTTTIETTLTWATNGPSNTDTDHPNEKIDYFVHITNDLKPFKLKFSDNVTILSETQVDNGVVYRISPVNNNIDKLNITIDSDGITPVNGKITVGKISKTDGRLFTTTTNELITEHGSTYKVAGSNTSIDFGRDLKDNYITADTSDVVFNPLNVYYTSYTPLKARGYVYKPTIDSNSEDRYLNADELSYSADSNLKGSPLYEDDIKGLEPGSTVVVNHKELPSRTVVEDNERFKRTVTYSYTYHKLKDIDGFKDDGTRTVAYNGTRSDMHAVFFYDEHVDEKIEWKTKPLTVNYIDSETNETLTSYTVQRLKDEPIGEFDQEYPNYTFERSDFNSTDLMGDSERTINMYFKHQKATVRTEVYVDNTLVSTSDKEVNTLSKVDKAASDLTLEHDNKVAKYVRTESDSDTVGEEGSVTTVKHYYETVSEINGVAVNVVFKDGNTVVGSTLAASTKSDNEISWSLTSNVSDTIDTNTYKPVNGDWATTELKGTLSYDSNKKVYTVEVPVTKRVGRIVVKYVDESGSEIRTPEVYKDQPIGTEYDKVSPTMNIPIETGYVNKDGKLYMRTTGYVRVTKDDFGPGTISEGDNVFTFIYKKVTKDIDATITGKVPNDAPIIDKDVKELTPDLHGTVYEADPTKPKGETEVVVEGSDGYTITSTSYTHDEKGNIITTPNTPEVVTPVTRVVKVGTKPKVEETPIGYYTRYERDDELTAGEHVTSVHGKEGKTTTTTTYTMNPDTGVVTENPSVTVEEKSVNEVIKVGTKPKIVTEQLTKEIRYTSDPTKDKGEKTVITEGENGKVVTITPYILNDVEGTVSEGKSEIVRHEGKPKIISVGTKPKVEVAKIPVTIRYEYNPNMDKDYRKVITEGSEGELTTTTTYTVNEQTGDLSESKSTVETVKMIERVIEIGTKETYVPNEAPVHEKPEYKGGVVPNDAPVHTLPEYEGGVVPNEAPVHTLPEYEGGVVPNDAPVHTIPE